MNDDVGWVCDVCNTETAACLTLCPECNNREQIINEIIKLVREMPNADERITNNLGMNCGLLDGGSVHRFTLIDKLEKMKVKANE
jgi:hypothetical protein